MIQKLNFIMVKKLYGQIMIKALTHCASHCFPDDLKFYTKQQQQVTNCC